MAKAIRVALVNDYMIVLEGLRALLRFSEPDIRVVEMDVRMGPRRGVDVTLFDTYGQHESLGDRVRALHVDSSNGAIVVFSFSVNLTWCAVPCVPELKGLSPRQYHDNKSSMG